MRLMPSASLGAIVEDGADRFLHRYRRPSTGRADNPTFSTPARFSSSMTVYISCAEIDASMRMNSDLSVAREERLPYPLRQHLEPHRFLADLHEPALLEVRRDRHVDGLAP